MRLVFCFLSLSFIFVSCVDLEKSTQLKQLTKLEKQLDSLKIVLIEVDNQSFKEDLLANKQLLKEVVELMAFDTLSETDARLIDNYSNTNQSLKLIENQMIQLTNQLVEQKKSLAKLNKDISNGFGKRNKYDEYIRFESRKCASVKTEIKYLRSKKERLITRANYLKDKIIILKQTHITKKHI